MLCIQYFSRFKSANECEENSTKVKVKERNSLEKLPFGVPLSCAQWLTSAFWHCCFVLNFLMWSNLDVSWAKHLFDTVYLENLNIATVRTRLPCLRYRCCPFTHGPVIPPVCLSTTFLQDSPGNLRDGCHLRVRITCRFRFYVLSFLRSMIHKYHPSNFSAFPWPLPLWCIYSHFSIVANPTLGDCLERALTLSENAKYCVAFCSGLSANLTIFNSLLETGNHVVHGEDCDGSIPRIPSSLID